MANYVRWGKKQKGHLHRISQQEFLGKVLGAKKKVNELSRKQLDRIIEKEWHKRLNAYDSAEWHLGEIKPSEVGVWKRAGELPTAWTNGSLADTARHVSYALLHGKLKRRKIRAAKAVKGILETNVNFLQKEKYLYPIVFKGGTGTNGRKGLKKRMKGDIDDGCMRSIALAINGSKRIKVYFGVPKK
jgi:hypothetical protein